MVGITATEQDIEKKNERNEDHLRGLWDNIRCIKIHIIRMSPRRRIERERL